MIDLNEFREKVFAILEKHGIDPNDLSPADWEILRSLENQFHPAVPNDQAEKAVIEAAEELLKRLQTSGQG